MNKTINKGTRDDFLGSLLFNRGCRVEVRLELWETWSWVGVGDNDGEGEEGDHGDREDGVVGLEINFSSMFLTLYPTFQ